MVKIKGIKLFDPRNDEWEISDNPALIFANIIHNHFITFPLEEDFWRKIAKMADFCDEIDFHLNMRSK